MSHVEIVTPKGTYRKVDRRNFVRHNRDGRVVKFQARDRAEIVRFTPGKTPDEFFAPAEEAEEIFYQGGQKSARVLELLMPDNLKRSSRVRSLW